jgi:hypothetical protein
MDGVIFGAKYLGSTQLLSERSPAPSTRMGQAQEAMDRVKVSQGGVPGLLDSMSQPPLTSVSPSYPAGP